MSEAPSIAGKGWREHAARWGGPAAILVSALAMLAWSWLKWPDLIVDFGLQLYTPWRLSEGDVLYRDVASLYGPFSSYFNAMLFSVLGASLHLLVWVNFIIFLGIVAMLYGLMCFITSRRTATIGCLVIVFVCGFGQYVGVGNYQFMTPYSHEATHGFALALAALTAFMQFGRHGKTAWLAAAGLCTGMVVLTKPEPMLAAAGAGAVALWLLVWKVYPARRAAGLTALFAAMVAVPVLIAVALFSLAVSPRDAVRSTFAAFLTSLNPGLRTLPLYREWMGTSDLPAFLRLMAVSACWYGLCLAALAGVAWVVARWVPANGRVAMAVGASLALVLVLVARGSEGWRDVGRPLPLLIAVLVGIFLWQYFRRPAERDPAAALRIVFCVFALLMLVRMFFNSRIYHFGFVLTVPALLCAVACLMEWIPAALDRRRKAAGPVFAIGAGTMLAVFVLMCISESNRFYRLKTYPVGTGADRYFSDRRALALQKLIAAFHGRLPPEATVAVMPENVMINYQLRRRTPTRFVQFMPSEMIAYGEDVILEEFQRHPADLVVLIHRNTAEYGPRYFANDYARELGQWIAKHYEPIGPPVGAVPFNPQDTFGILVLGRSVASTANAPAATQPR